MTVLLVLFTIVFFITLDYFVYRKKGTALIQIAKDTIANDNLSSIQPKNIVKEEDIMLPKGVFLHPKHTWVFLLQSGNVKIGVDSFISKLINGIEKVGLPPIGIEVKKGQAIVNVYSKDKKLTFASPIDGKIVSVNDELMENPSLLKDPYRNGWTIVVQPKNLAADILNLKVADEAINFLKQEYRRFKDFILSLNNVKNLGLQTIQDGGLPVEGVLASLDKEKWELFQKQFLNS